MGDTKRTVRVMPIEIVGIDGGGAEAFRAARDRWMLLGRASQRLANCVWREWLAYHVAAGSPAKLQAWLANEGRTDKEVKAKIKDVNREFDERKAKLDADGVPRVDQRRRDLQRERQEAVAAAGACPVECLSAELSARIYAAAVKATPELHSRSRVLSLNAMQGDLKTRKAAKGSLPGWSAKLLCHEAIPSFTRPQPIAIDKKNGLLLPPKDKDSDEYRFRLRLERQDDGAAVEDIVRLRTGGAAWKVKRIVDRIAQGEWEFVGSDVVFRDDCGKWFLNLCYRLPVEPTADVDPEKVATLVAMRGEAWSLRIPGERRWAPLRQPQVVREQRRRIMLARKQMQGAYRTPAEGRKGHGRNRAIAPMGRLRTAWDNFCRTLNQQMAAAMIRRCIRGGAGKVVYFQPTGAWSDSRFLARSGKSPDPRDREASGWQWHQMATILASKCQFHGLEFEVVKVEDAPNWWDSGTATDGKPKRRKGMPVKG